MATPSSQIAAIWVKETFRNTEWSALRDVLHKTMSQKWTGKTEEDIWEFVEDKISYVAEEIRNDLSESMLDGTPTKFEIDSEQSPYIRFTGAPDDLLGKIRRIDPFAVESLCAKILDSLGASSYSTKKTGDGGVDFIATNLNIVPNGFGIPSVCKATVIGQTKRYQSNNVIVEKSVREFVGAGVLQRHKLRLDSGICPLSPVILAFWTTSSFEPNAKKFAREVGLWYMDGDTLAGYVSALELEGYVDTLPLDSTLVAS